MSRLCKPLIALAAGGTGGHVFPALAVAEALTRADVDTVVLTDRRGAALMPDSGAITLPAGSPFQRGLLRRLNAGLQLTAGTLASLFLILRRRPAAVIGFGGYPSFAPLLAARICGVPSLLHEQNAFLGRANRLLARWTGHLALSWQGTRNLPDGIDSFTAGMPVRAAFYKIKAQPVKPAGKLQLTVIGGSLGAAVFADLLPKAIGLLPPIILKKLTITQQCRIEQIHGLTNAYEAIGVTARIKPFFDDMPSILAASHLVISRAGASSVAELAAAGRPAIFVPFAAAMDDHQTANAMQMQAVGGGKCLAQDDLTAEALATTLTALLGDPAGLSAMGAAARQLAVPQAADSIAEYALTLAGRRGPSSPEQQERQSGKSVCDE